MKRTPFLLECLLILFNASIIFSGITWAADYPSKTITLLCPYAAGGSIDAQTRGLTPYLARELNTNVIIENVPGASGVIGSNKAFKSAPDGYTLLTGSVPTLYISEILSESSRYRTTGFVPIYAFARDNVALFVHPEVFQKFDDFAKAAHNRTLNIGVSGIGTPTHLAGLLTEEFLGVKLNFVPFESGALTVGTLAGKHIDGALTFTTTALAMVKAGKIKPFLIFSSERNPYYPEIPIPKEFGYDVPSIAMVYGVWAPPNISSEKVRILESAFDRAVKNPKYKEWREKLPSEYIQMNAKDFKAEIEMQIKAVDAHKKSIK